MQNWYSPRALLFSASVLNQCSHMLLHVAFECVVRGRGWISSEKRDRLLEQFVPETVTAPDTLRRFTQQSVKTARENATPQLESLNI